MIIVDTNVISEWLRQDADQMVVAWYNAQATSETYVTAITEAEMRFGVARLPAGKKRDALSPRVAALFETGFEHRRLPFDSVAAVVFAEIVVKAGLNPKHIDLFDAQIAAIAVAHRATLATRNTKDFAVYGVDLVNPWGSD